MTDYAIEGPVWSTPLNVTYAWANPSTTSYSSGGAVFTDAITGAYQTLVQSAMAAWQAVANVKFTLVASTAGADLDIGWMNFTTAGQLGTTNYASYTDGTGKQDFIAGTFVGFEDPVDDAVGSDQTSLYGGYNTTLYQVMMHELGHSLGLAHSTNVNALMYPTLGPSDRAISSYDVAGMQSLYGAPAGTGTQASTPTTTISGINISADSNVVGDFVTNVASQTVTATLSATLAAGETLMGSVNGGTTWTNITSFANGRAIAWTGVTLAGTNGINLKVTNSAGDGAIASQAYTLDTTPPTTTISSIHLSADSGIAGDFVTNVASQTITATLGSALASTDRLYASANGGTTWTDVTSQVASTTLTWTGVTLASGASSLAFKAMDLAGNYGATTSQGYTLDTTAPATPSVAPNLAPASDSGVQGDHVTNVATPTITGAGAEAGSTVRLYDTDGITVLGTAIAGAGGTYSIASSSLSQGTHVLTVRATDVAGNASAASPALSLTIDTTAPATPAAAPTLAPASDSGLAGDRITNVRTPTITGTGVEANSTVNLYDGNGTTPLGTATATAAGTYGITSASLADGIHTLTVKAIDAAGNTSGASAPLLLTIDTTAPAAPTPAPTLAPASDSGTPGDRITNAATPTIDGSGAEPGSTVALLDTDGATVLGTAVATNTGTYAITSSTLDDGVHDLTVRATDAAGNVGSASAALVVTIDTTAPAPPNLPPTLAATSDSGIAGDDVTNVTAPTITGAGTEPGSTVRLYDAGGPTLLGTSVTTTAGTYAIASTHLADGMHVLTVRATDAAGNVGAASPALDLTIDSTAPAAPTTAPTLAAPSDSGAIGDGITNVANPTITGSGAEAGSTVRLYDTNGTTVLGTGNAGAAGTYSITSSTLGDGQHGLTVRATDAAGNAGAASPTLVLTIDTVAPATTISAISLSNGTNAAGTLVASSASQTVAATLNAALAGGDRLYGSTDGGSTWTDVTGMTAGTTLTWTGVTLSGSNSIELKTTDLAGNTGKVASQAYVVVTPPVIVTPVIVTPPVVVTPPPVVTTPVVTPPVVTPPVVTPPVVTPPVVTPTAVTTQATVTPPAVVTPPEVVTQPTIVTPPSTVTTSVVATTVVVTTPPIQTTPATTQPVPATPPVAVTTVVPTTASAGDPTADAPPDAASPIATPAPTTATDQFPAPAVVNTVYRFFDSTHGTQFLTSDATERDDIIATRPDLTFEGKAMGSVTADPANPNVAPVYRFFDGSNGTHFFTTSAGERDQILASRHDMVLEQTNMFEHATQQAGDVAVYRFFETTDGSHFFTSNQSEIATITQSRPDMVAEGVSFYAPNV